MNISTQEKMSDDLNEISLPFKGGTLYDRRSEQDILKEIKEGDKPSTNLNIKFSDYYVTIFNCGVYQTVIRYTNNNKPVYLEDNDREKEVDIRVFNVIQC